MDYERHHRRIRRTGRSAIGAFGIFIVVGLCWLFTRLLLCTSAKSSTFWICQSSFYVPLFVSLVSIVLFILLIRFLNGLGNDLEVSGIVKPTDYRGIRRFRHHVRQGYHNLDKKHKSHVHRSLFSAIGAVVAVISFMIFYFEKIPSFIPYRWAPQFVVVTGILGLALIYWIIQLWFKRA